MPLLKPLLPCPPFSPPSPPLFPPSSLSIPLPSSLSPPSPLLPHSPPLTLCVCRLKIKDQQLSALQDKAADLQGLLDGAREEVKGKDEQIKRLERKLVFVTKVKFEWLVVGLEQRP